jgi:ABC-type transporter Mla subunit MlaD
MRNPLMLPVVALGVAVNVARALAGIPRILQALDGALDRLERITGQADAVLAELQQARPMMERLSEQAELVLDEVRQARPMVERLNDQAQAVLDQITESTKAVERLMMGGADVVAVADRTREEAAEVRRMIEETLEMAQPKERVTGRVGRFTGAFRRSSSAETGT